MRKSMVTMVFVAASCCFVGNAFGEKVDISGKHSKSEIKETCGKVGGDYAAFPTTGGYGCINTCKDQDGLNGVCTVHCTKDKKCTGTVPDRRVPGERIGDVLTNSVGAVKAESAP